MQFIQILRIINAVLLFFICWVLIVGPAFHLRQEWRGYCTSKKNPKLDIMVHCGKSVDDGVFTTWKSMGQLCRIPNYPDLDVASLQGYNGWALLTMWNTLGITGQYFCLLYCVICLAMQVALVMSLKPEMNMPPKLATVCMDGFNAMMMLLITGLQFYFINCGQYALNTRTRFHADMRNPEYQGDCVKGINVEDNNIVVECKIMGYGISAVIAILCATLFFAQLFIVLKMKPVQEYKEDDEELLKLKDA